MRRVLIVRPGISKVNDPNKIGGLAFGGVNAPLIPDGVRQSYRAGHIIRKTFAVEPVGTDVAVAAEYLRAKETAIAAGFDPRDMGFYAVLNEARIGIRSSELWDKLARREIPRAAIRAAEILLENPPPEPVWITGDGLLEPAVREVMGLPLPENPFPDFGEIRELPIDQSEPK
jgi:hypothetical protein